MGDGSTDTNTAGIGIELPTRTLGQGVTITSQGTMDGRTCYSSDSVANMFVNVATGVTTSLAETNQDTDELHVYHLGNSDCDESNIVGPTRMSNWGVLLWSQVSNAQIWSVVDDIYPNLR